MVCVVFLLESLVRALVATWAECRDALVKHHAIVTIFATADPTRSWRGWFTVAHHWAILCPSLSFNEDVYKSKSQNEAKKKVDVGHRDLNHMFKMRQAMATYCFGS
jgi:hypothetical protein